MCNSNNYKGCGHSPRERKEWRYTSLNQKDKGKRRDLLRQGGRESVERREERTKGWGNWLKKGQLPIKVRRFLEKTKETLADVDIEQLGGAV